MRDVNNYSPRFLTNWKIKLGRCAIIVSLAVGSVMALPTYAASGGLTQLEYIQWLVQLSGEAARFSEASVPNDYVVWARSHGMDPKAGWSLNSKVSRDVLAQTIAQFLKLNPGQQSDYIRILQRNGIEIPEPNELSRGDISNFFGHQTPSVFRCHSPPRPNPKPDRDDDDGRGHGRDRDDDDGNMPRPGWSPPGQHPGRGPGNQR